MAWLKERTSQHYTMAKEMDTQKDKVSILLPAPKKFFLDCASNRLARTISQIWKRHWLCRLYLKPQEKLG
jgi:uncharacterized protein YciW